MKTKEPNKQFVHKYSPLVTNLRRNKNGMDVCCFRVHRNQQRKRSKIKIPFSELIASNKIIRHFPPPPPPPSPRINRLLVETRAKAKQKDVTSETKRISKYNHEEK